jgi:hypothetical protein
MRDAANESRYYQTIAQQIAAYLPPSARVFDAGGGLGDLARWLSYHVEHVTVMEHDPKAVASIRALCPPNVTAMLADVFTYLPDRQFDALVLCFFGKANEILPLARELTSGKTFVVQFAETNRGFSLDAQAKHHETILDAERALQQEGVAYKKITFEVEHGQPLRSMEDAIAFFSHYSKRAVTREEVEPRLTKTDNVTFPFYVPQKRSLAMLQFDALQAPR